MALNEEVVRRIVREELAKVREGWEQLTRAVEASTEEARGRVLSIEDAAAYLGGLPVTTMQALVRKREIGFVKAGRSTVFPRAELDAYIDAHTMPVEETPWGLTEGALRHIRAGRLPGPGRAS